MKAQELIKVLEPHKPFLQEIANGLFYVNMSSRNFMKCLNMHIQVLSGEEVDSDNDFYTDWYEMITVLDWLGYTREKYGLAKKSDVSIYKLRAEAECDINSFIEEFPSMVALGFMSRDKMMLDLEFEFSSRYSINAIKSALSQLDDCHVMEQTLQPIKLYTGERVDD